MNILLHSGSEDWKKKKWWWWNDELGSVILYMYRYNFAYMRERDVVCGG